MTEYGRPKLRAQIHMEEQQLQIAELAPLLETIDTLKGELEEDEETKARRKELRTANKRLKEIITGAKLTDGFYRVALTPWILDVKNIAGGTKDVTYGASVKVKIESVE